MDLTSLTPGQIVIIAAVATLLSALVAGTFAVSTALVNAWAQRRLFQSNARREYLLKHLLPAIEQLQACDGCRQLYILAAATRGELTSYIFDSKVMSVGKLKRELNKALANVKEPMVRLDEPGIGSISSHS